LKRSRYIALLAEGLVAGKTKAAIAREAGFNVAAFAGLEADPEFQVMFDSLISDRQKRTKMQLEVMSALALKAHMEIMADVAHRDRLAASESVLDRVGLGKTSKVQQTTVGVMGVAAITEDFKGRSLADLEHYALHGRFPEDG